VGRFVSAVEPAAGGALIVGGAGCSNSSETCCKQCCSQFRSAASVSAFSATSGLCISCRSLGIASANSFWSISWMMALMRALYSEGRCGTALASERGATSVLRRAGAVAGRGTAAGVRLEPEPGTNAGGSASPSF
jgi:hypothetical protein